MSVLKSKFLQIRISDTLKRRYEEALKADGITKSDHINSMILRFVEEYEKRGLPKPTTKKLKKKNGDDTILAFLSDMQNAEEIEPPLK